MCIYSAASIIPFTLHHYMGVALPAVQLPACLAMVPSLGRVWFRVKSRFSKKDEFSHGVLNVVYL